MTTPGGDAIAEFARRMGAMPANLQARIRFEIGQAAGDVTADMKQRASWSSRIPGSIRANVTTGGKGVSVTWRAGGGSAPHARPFEGIGGNSTFRHPVFGNYDNWVSQGTRPFMRPALLSRRDRLELAVTHAIDDAAGMAGFR